jgi:ribose transport system substrate-binding protein
MRITRSAKLVAGVGFLCVALLIATWGASAQSTKSRASGHKVGYVTATGVLYYTCVAKGVKQTVEKHGNSFVQAFSTGTAQSELAAAQDLLAQHIDALVLLSTNAKSGSAVVALAKKAGIPVVLNTQDEFLHHNYSKVNGVFAWNFPALGAATGRLAAKVFPRGTKAASIEPIAGNVHAIDVGFRNAVQAAGFKWLGIYPAKDYDPTDVQHATQDLLTAHPDVQVIYIDDTGSVSAMFAAIKIAHSKASVVPTGGRDEDKGLVQAGKLKAYTAAPAFLQGQGSATMIDAVLDGKTLPHKVVHPDPLPVTAANVNQAPPNCGPSATTDKYVKKVTGL